MKTAFISCAAASLLSVGCLGNDAVVFVEPSIEEAQLAVESKTLGTDLTGSFRLVLLLGPRASGASQVSVQTFAVVSADQTKTIIPTLETATVTTFPVTVDVDSEVSATFTIDLGGSLLPASTAGELCGAGGLKITGSIQDSLQTGASPAASDVFQPSGCP